MLWLLFAFIPAIGDGLGNIIDGHFSNKDFKNPWVLLFYSGLTELIFLPLVLFYKLPSLISLNLFLLFGVVAFLDFLTLVLYYQALKEDDTSVVASLFSLGKIFIPILAYFVVGERLSWAQYIAFVVIIFSSALLTATTQGKKIKFNKSLLLMFGSSVIHSIEGVIYKYALDKVDWASGFFYVVVFSVIGYLMIVIFKSAEIKKHFIHYKNNLKFMFFASGIAFVANLSSALAYSLAPITLVKGVFATQPFFIIIFSYFMRGKFKVEYREKMDKKNLIKKLVFFSIILVALIFVVE